MTILLIARTFYRANYILSEIYYKNEDIVDCYDRQRGELYLKDGTLVMAYSLNILNKYVKIPADQLWLEYDEKIVTNSGCHEFMLNFWGTSNVPEEYRIFIL